MITTINVERTQQGMVELDIDNISSASSIKEAIEEADQQGQIKWQDMSSISISNISVDAYLAVCKEKGAENDPYHLIILAESKESAIELIEDYMAGMTSEDYTIKLSTADRYDVAKYINDESSFSFEGGGYEIDTSAEKGMDY